MNKMFEEKIWKCSQKKYSLYDQWYIVFSEHSEINHHCICGHNVKRITYIYNKFTKHIMLIGSTCAKKFGIKQHLNNCILLVNIKQFIQSNTYDFTPFHIEDTNDSHSKPFISLYKDGIMNEKWSIKDGVITIPDFSNMLKNYIQTRYLDFQEKIRQCIANGIDIDYYDIVLPFRRLLNDVCYLVTEYNYDFMILLKEIESNVNAMNNTVKHIIIDETNEDALSEDQSFSDNNLLHEEPFRIIDAVCVEDEEPSIIEQIHIVDETVNIQTENIFFTIDEIDCVSEPDIFICDFCDADFNSMDIRNHHEITCHNNLHIYNEPEDIEIESVSDFYINSLDEVVEEFVDEDIAEHVVEHVNESDNKLKHIKTSIQYHAGIESIMNIDKCYGCLNNVTSYCYCANRYRIRKLAIEILELKKIVADLSFRSSELIKNAMKLNNKMKADFGNYIDHSSISLESSS